MAGDKAVPHLNGEVLVTSDTTQNGSATVNEPGLQQQSNASPTHFDCDALVVGAGFSGITAIHRFRKLGLNVKCFESGGDFGGVWYWNRYPGARVDSEVPFYQLNIPEVYRTWSFSMRFPDHHELREYTAHVDKVLDLRKDTTFHARVVDATWDQDRSVWNVKTHQGHSATCRYLMLATGLLHRTYTPDFPGLGDYKGDLYHSGAFDENFSAKGKKVALIGAGATAVQITQELGKTADHLTVFVRRPSYCLPLQQRQWPKEVQQSWKAYYPALFKAGRESLAGFPSKNREQNAQDVPDQEREEHFEDIWARGGFQFLGSNYQNMFVDKVANRIVYDYWRKRVCERLTDPAKQKIMAPTEPPYHFATKRNPLETDYYDVLNRPNVVIHDINAVPLKSFTERGLLMGDETHHEFDAVIFATGWDSYSGSLTQMGLKNKDGVPLADLWKDGIHTYLGLTISGFPNMFMAYTPQSPTALSNGPTIIEAQVETIAAMIAKLESEGARSIEAKPEAEAEWDATVGALAQHTLLPFTDSWWTGTNVPGRKAGNLVYIGGINNYEPQCRATMDGWKGFEVVTGKA